jgi:uncharacterized protein (DUF488 family)
VRAVYTIGHSTRSVAELVAILRAHGVDELVDIRTIRRSRANPQFGEARLRAALARRGVSYRVIAALGGRRGKPKQPPRLANDAWQHSAFRNYADYAETPEFRAGLAELMAEAKRQTVAIMCAEAVWWRCHRRIVADHLIAHHVPVLHLMSEHAATVATPTPFAVIRRDRVHYPAPPRGAR